MNKQLHKWPWSKNIDLIYILLRYKLINKDQINKINGIIKNYDNYKMLNILFELLTNQLPDGTCMSLKKDKIEIKFFMYIYDVEYNEYMYITYDDWFLSTKKIKDI